MWMRQLCVYVYASVCHVPLCECICVHVCMCVCTSRTYPLHSHTHTVLMWTLFPLLAHIFFNSLPFEVDIWKEVHVCHVCTLYTVYFHNLNCLALHTDQAWRPAPSIFSLPVFVCVWLFLVSLWCCVTLDTRLLRWLASRYKTYIFPCTRAVKPYK